MKKAIFNPQWYFDGGAYRKEWDNLYSKVWMYAGLTARVKDEGSYFTLQLFDKEMVIHRLQGEIKAYLNVCPHRGGPLVLGRDGKGSPVCKYHGWAFRSGEKLTGLTNLEWFNADASPSACKRELRPLSVKVLGPVIFVNFSGAPMPIEEQYSDEILSTLASYGEISDFAVSIFNSPINWKLNIENVKDFLHPFYVHPDSLKPFLSYEEKPAARIEEQLIKDPEEYHSNAGLKDLSFLQRSELKIPPPWWRGNIKITQPEATYQNIFLFPNTNFCSVSGAHYVIQQYLPRSPESFDYILTAALPEKAMKFDTSVLLSSIIKIERAVIYEDDLVLMKVQQNLKSGLEKEHFTHGDYEAPIMNQLSYMKNSVY
jgi:phenylpropionate dioxygenase-like ring-hydroxylating dioxygenase large terminal subunit